MREPLRIVLRFARWGIGLGIAIALVLVVPVVALAVIFGVWR